MPRFVLLRHQLPAESGKSSHWDLMLESDGRLVTWNLYKLPRLWQAALQHREDGGQPVGTAIRSASLAEQDAQQAMKDQVRAEQIGEHRLAYLDYEGPVSEGRGRVARCDEGEYELVEGTNDRWQIRLSGSRLRGLIDLVRLDRQDWQLQLRMPPESPLD